VIRTRPSFEHLIRLSDDTGLLEHARGAAPRRHCGYCVDDAARALIVVTREPAAGAAVARLGERALALIAHAQGDGGRFRNRLGFDRRWEDEPGIGDWCGRALWALGTAVAHHPAPWVQEEALACFELGAGLRSGFPRTMAYAALGAADVLGVWPDNAAALSLAEAATMIIGRPRKGAWPWPEDRLTYANAVLPEALIAAGSRLGESARVTDGVDLLEWLVGVETLDDHFSVTSSAGRSSVDASPAFDQQPIEVACLADACARALAVTKDPEWAVGIERAVRWFEGDNDKGLPLLDPLTGGGYDALTASGVNTNEGAESTLALISTLQMREQGRCG
jgi:hypothetical protein